MKLPPCAKKLQLGLMVGSSSKSMIQNFLIITNVPGTDCVYSLLPVMKVSTNSGVDSR